jgi:hypothetical protein
MEAGVFGRKWLYLGTVKWEPHMTENAMTALALVPKSNFVGVVFHHWWWRQQALP